MNHVEPIRVFLLYYSVWIGSRRTRKLQQGELEAYHHSYYVRKSDKYSVGERGRGEGGGKDRYEASFESFALFMFKVSSTSGLRLNSSSHT